MKNVILACLITLAGLASGQAQTAIQVTVKPDKTVPAGFTREKFDPTRDPKVDLEAAMTTAASEGKRIILDVGGEWCGWCVYMDKFFFLNPKVDKLRRDNFVWLKVNMSEENENRAFLSPFPVPHGYPHLYVLDAEGKLLHSQDTATLETKTGYSVSKFSSFLKKWSRPKTP